MQIGRLLKKKTGVGGDRTLDPDKVRRLRAFYIFSAPQERSIASLSTTIRSLSNNGSDLITISSVSSIIDRRIVVKLRVCLTFSMR